MLILCALELKAHTKTHSIQSQVWQTSQQRKASTKHNLESTQELVLRQPKSDKFHRLWSPLVMKDRGRNQACRACLSFTISNHLMPSCGITLDKHLYLSSCLVWLHTHLSYTLQSWFSYIYIWKTDISVLTFLHLCLHWCFCQLSFSPLTTQLTLRLNCSGPSSQRLTLRSTQRLGENVHVQGLGIEMWWTSSCTQWR